MKVAGMLIAGVVVVNGIAVIFGYHAGGAGLSVIAALLAGAIYQYRRSSR